MSLLDKFDRKSPKEIELEKKIKTLREAGMTASADRIEYQLHCLKRGEDGKEKMVRPISQQEQVRAIKAAKKAV